MLWVTMASDCKTAIFLSCRKPEKSLRTFNDLDAFPGAYIFDERDNKLAKSLRPGESQRILGLKLGAAE